MGHYLLAVLVNIHDLGRGGCGGGRQTLLALDVAAAGRGLGAGHQVGGGIALLMRSLVCCFRLGAHAICR